MLYCRFVTRGVGWRQPGLCCRHTGALQHAYMFPNFGPTLFQADFDCGTPLPGIERPCYVTAHAGGRVAGHRAPAPAPLPAAAADPKLQKRGVQTLFQGLCIMSSIIKVHMSALDPYVIAWIRPHLLRF